MCIQDCIPGRFFGVHISYSRPVDSRTGWGRGVGGIDVEVQLTRGSFCMLHTFTNEPKNICQNSLILQVV